METLTFPFGTTPVEVINDRLAMDLAPSGPASSEVAGPIANPDEDARDQHELGGGTTLSGAENHITMLDALTVTTRVVYAGDTTCPAAQLRIAILASLGISEGHRKS